MVKRRSGRILNVASTAAFLAGPLMNLITARVISVADGDSITVLAPGNMKLKIRLYGIGCPEGGQAFGRRAKQFTSTQCYRKTIQYREVDADRYGRTVATVYLEDGRELNLEIHKAGSHGITNGTLMGRTMLRLRITPEELI